MTPPTQYKSIGRTEVDEQGQPVASNTARNGPALRLNDFGVLGRNIINFIHVPKNAGTSIKNLCGKQLVYHNHSVNVRSKHLNHQLIILRNPIERFVSAFYYSIEYYRHHTHIRDLYYHHIVSPNRLIELLSDTTHPFHRKAKNLLANDGTQRIGDEKHPYKWIYSPQSLYVHQPKYVILFENLNEEWRQFAEYHRLERPELPNTNTTRKRQDEPLTPQSVDFIRKLYAEDVQILETFRALPVETRLTGIPYPLRNPQK